MPGLLDPGATCNTGNYRELAFAYQIQGGQLTAVFIHPRVWQSTARAQRGLIEQFTVLGKYKRLICIFYNRIGLIANVQLHALGRKFIGFQLDGFPEGLPALGAFWRVVFQRANILVHLLRGQTCRQVQRLEERCEVLDAFIGPTNDLPPNGNALGIVGFKQ